MSTQQPSRIDENAILFAAIDSIIPNPRQPRRAFRDDDPKLLELSASIKEHGLIQPIIVTRLDKSSTAQEVREPASDWFGSDDMLSSDMPLSQDSEQPASTNIKYQII